MRTYPVGSDVYVRTPDRVGVLVRRATVVRHGRDASGIYTEVRYEDGETDRHHRDSIKPVICYRCGHDSRHLFREGGCTCRNHVGVPSARAAPAKAEGR